MNVLLVGIDGLGGYYMGLEGSESLQRRMPTLCTLMEHSAVSTLAAQTVFPPISAPAWVSALTGLTPEATGVVHKVWDPQCVPALVLRPGTSMPWTVYDSLRQCSGSSSTHTSIIASWSWLLQLVGGDEPVCDFAYDAAGDDDAAVAGFAASCDADDGSKRNRFSFVHLDMVDAAGHRYSWESDAYRDAWSDADKRLAVILAAAEVHSQLRHRELAVVVVSDHGGSGHDHGTMVPSHMQIPLVVRPPAGWKRSAALPRSAPTIVDVTPTVLTLLSVPAPAWMVGYALIET